MEIGPHFQQQLQHSCRLNCLENVAQPCPARYRFIMDVPDVPKNSKECQGHHPRSMASCQLNSRRSFLWPRVLCVPWTPHYAQATNHCFPALHLRLKPRQPVILENPPPLKENCGYHPHIPGCDKCVRMCPISNDQTLKILVLLINHLKSNQNLSNRYFPWTSPHSAQPASSAPCTASKEPQHTAARKSWTRCHCLGILDQKPIRLICLSILLTICLANLSYMVSYA